MNEAHVVPATGDQPGWMIDEDLELFETQEQAVARAFERLGGTGEVVIHGADGQIRERIRLGVEVEPA